MIFLSLFKGQSFILQKVEIFKIQDARCILTRTNKVDFLEIFNLPKKEKTDGFIGQKHLSMDHVQRLCNGQGSTVQRI